MEDVFMNLVHKKFYLLKRSDPNTNRATQKGNDLSWLSNLATHFVKPI